MCVYCKKKEQEVVNRYEREAEVKGTELSGEAADVDDG